MTTRVLSWLAFICAAYAVQLHQAQQECLEALALAEQIGAHTPMGRVSVLLPVRYLLRLEWAGRGIWLAPAARRLAQEWQHVELLVRVEICSVQLALAPGGNFSAAEAGLHRLEVLLEQGGFVYHAPWLMVSKSNCGWLREI